MKSINGERSLNFIVYVVVLLVSFSVIQMIHALDLAEESGADIGSAEKRIGPITCSTHSIQVNQGASGTLPNGIPTYTVVIENVCVSGSCSISNIHLSCGWFSSARLINPGVFRRLGYNDCLVNNGAPLRPGQAITFQYANTFKYPMVVSSVAC